MNILRQQRRLRNVLKTSIHFARNNLLMLYILWIKVIFSLVPLLTLVCSRQRNCFETGYQRGGCVNVGKEWKVWIKFVFSNNNLLHSNFCELVKNSQTQSFQIQTGVGPLNFMLGRLVPCKLPYIMLNTLEPHYTMNESQIPTRKSPKTHKKF